MTDHKPLRILLADDDMLIQIAHQALLKQVCDCDITLARDGAEAVRLVSDGYDILFIDIHMPILNGIEATIQIRSNVECKTLPIVGVTADPNPDVRQRCLKGGMNDVLLKPVSADTFREILGKYVGF
jgi:CheY-like chemotaxis protein